MTPAISVEALTARYGRTGVLNGIDFEVPAGQCLALLGENGAGKSTLLQILAGQLRERSGRVRVNGYTGRSLKARRQLAYSPQFLDFPGGLRVRELLAFVAGLYGSSAQLQQRVYADFGLAELEGRPADRLSGGEAKRVSLAMAFAAGTPVLLLDEPMASLDQQYQRTLESYLSQLRGQRTIVFVSHDLPESLQVADRLMRLQQGRISDDELVNRSRQLCLLSFTASVCPALTGVLQQRRSDNRWEIRGFDGDDLVRQLVNSQTPFSELSLSREGGSL